LELGKVMIWLINTSSKTLEAVLKTYKTCKSPRHKVEHTKTTEKQDEKMLYRGIGLC